MRIVAEGDGSEFIRSYSPPLIAMKPLIKSTLAVAALAGLTLTAHAVVIQTFDFEGGGGDGNGLDGWNVIATGVGNDAVFTPAGANPPTGAQPVIPTAFDSASVQGQWAVRTWDNQITGTTSDGNTGAIRTNEFTLPLNAVVDFLIGGGNHPWGAMDPDSLGAGPGSFNLERMVSPGDWETIATATGPNANTLSAGSFTGLDGFAGDTVRFAIYDLSTGGWGHIDVDNIVLSGDPIPEPGTAGLGLLGLFGLLFLRRRKRA
jgi:levanase